MADKISVKNIVTPVMTTKSMIFPSVDKKIAESPNIAVRKYTTARTWLLESPISIRRKCKWLVWSPFIGFCPRLRRIRITYIASIIYTPSTAIVVAIFPPAMMASVAIKNAKIIVPVSPIITSRLISARIRKKVAGTSTARIVRINRLFSWLAREISVRNNLNARIPRIINEINAKPLVIPGTPSEKFTELKINTYQTIVIITGKI